MKACHPCIYITVTKYQMKYEKLCRFVDFVSRNILVLEHKLHRKFYFSWAFDYGKSRLLLQWSDLPLSRRVLRLLRWPVISVKAWHEFRLQLRWSNKTGETKDSWLDDSLLWNTFPDHPWSNFQIKKKRRQNWWQLPLKFSVWPLLMKLSTDALLMTLNIAVM